MLSLKRNNALPPAPVSTNLLPLESTTSKRTEVPACVNVTVPNDVAVPHPPVTWQLVKVKTSARAGLAVAIKATPIMATPNAIHPPPAWYSSPLLGIISSFG